MESQNNEFKASFITAEAASAPVAVNPDMWTAVDMLGRRLPDCKTAGKKRGKAVGLFYWTWHYNFARNTKPRNVTEILEKYPEAVNDFSHPAWENTASGTPYHWDEPLFGYYQNLDDYVVRKHAELIADAGVDVIVFDCTNGDFTWQPAYKVLCRVFKEAMQEGVNVPKIAFMLNFAPVEDSRKMLNIIYDDIYSSDEYKCLWYYWDGKPLIMAHQQCLDMSVPKERAIFDFFTFKNNEPTYFASDTAIGQNRWGWCSVYPQTRFGVREDGSVEQMTVNVAQNANDRGLNAMNANGGVGTYGRSYAKGDYSYEYEYAGKKIVAQKNIENSYLYGLNFQQQWDYALSVDPDFIFVTGWNEWIAGRHKEWIGTENAFPDQFDYEHSRDAEPSKGVLKDAFYYQLAANIRRFKGMSCRNEIDAFRSIDIKGGAEQWRSVKPEFAHYIGSTKKRDADGWLGTHYDGKAVRNDIKLSKIAYDDKFIYFLAETVDDLTPPEDGEWMRLLIDTDEGGLSPNWEGFEYIINRSSPVSGKTSVEKSLGGFSWEKVGDAEIEIAGKLLQIKVDRKLLGFEPDGSVPHMNFKWADDNIRYGDIMELYTDGEAAPGGRFTFKF